MSSSKPTVQVSGQRQNEENNWQRVNEALQATNDRLTHTNKELEKDLVNAKNNWTECIAHQKELLKNDEEQKESLNQAKKVIDSLTHDKQQLESDVQSLTERVEGLRNELIDCNTRLANEESAKTIAVLQDEIKLAKVTITAHETKHKAQHHEIHHLAESLGNCKTEKKALHDRLEETECLLQGATDQLKELNRLKAILDTEHNSLKTNCGHQEARIREFEEYLNRSRQERECLDREHAELKQKHSTVNSDYQTLFATCRRHELDKDSLQRDLDVFGVKHSALQGELQACRGKLNNEKTAHSDKCATIKVHESTISDLNYANNKLKAEAEKLQSMLTALQQDLANVNNAKTPEGQNEALEKLNKDVKTYEKQVGELKQHNKHLQDNVIGSLNQDLDNLRKSKAELYQQFHEKNTDLTATKKSLVDINYAKDKLDREHNALKCKHDEYFNELTGVRKELLDHKAFRDQYEAEQLPIHSKHKQLYEENCKLREEIAQRSESQVTHDLVLSNCSKKEIELEERVKVLEKEIEVHILNLTNKDNAWNDQCKTMADHINDKDNLKLQLDQKCKSHSLLEGRLKESQDKCTTFDAKCAEIIRLEQELLTVKRHLNEHQCNHELKSTQLGDLQKLYDACNTDKSNLTTQVNAHAEDLKKLQNAQELLQRDHDSWKGKHDELNAKHIAKEKEYEELKNSHDELFHSHQCKDKDHNTLKSEHDTLQLNYNSLCDEMELHKNAKGEVERDLHTHKEHKQQLDLLLQTLRVEVADCQGVINELKSQLHNAGIEINEHKGQHNHYKNKVDGCVLELAQHKEKNAKLSADCKSRDEEITRRCNEIERINNLHSELNEKYNLLHSTNCNNAQEFQALHELFEKFKISASHSEKEYAHHAKTVVELNEVNLKLMEDVKHLNDEIAMLKRTLKIAQDNEHLLEEMVIKYGGELGIKTTSLTEFTNKYHESNASNIDLDLLKKQQELEIANLKQLMNKLEADLQRVKETSCKDNEKNIAAIAKMNEDLANGKVTIDGLEKEKLIATHKHGQLATELNNAQSSHSKLRDQYDQQCVALQAAHSKCSEWEKENKKVCKDHSTLAEQLKCKMDEYGQVYAQLCEHKTRQTDLENELLRWQSKHNEVSQHRDTLINEAQLHQQQLDTHATNLLISQQKEQELNAKLVSITMERDSHSKKLNELEVELNQVCTDSKNHVHTRKELEVELTKYKDLAVKFENECKELINCKTIKEATDLEIESIKQELSAIKVERDEHAKCSEHLKNIQIPKLEGDYNKSKEEHSRLMDEFTARGTELGGCKNELATLRSACEKKNKEYGELHNTHKEHLDIHEQTKKKLLDIEKCFQVSDTEAKRVQKVNLELNALNNELMHQLEHHKLEDEKRELNLQAAKFNEDLLEKWNANLRADNFSLKLKVNTLEIKARNNDDSVKVSSQNISKLQKEVEYLKKRINLLEKEIEELRSKNRANLGQKEQELNKVKEDLKKAEDRVRAFEDNISRLHRHVIGPLQSELIQCGAAARAAVIVGTTN